MTDAASGGCDGVRAEAWEVAERAEGLPHGPGQVALHEEAIALADRGRDIDLGYDLRRNALWPFYHGKRPDLLMVHFAWCAAHHDARPDRDDPHGLLFTYRWVIDAMPQFETIPLATIHATWQDMRSCYERAGLSPRPCWVLKRRVECALGDLAAAADANRRYRKCRRDAASDDGETEAAFDVFYRARLKDDAGTLKAAAPFLDGRLSDPAFLIGVFDSLLLPLARRGRLDEARALVKRSVRFMASRPELLGTADDQIEFLAVTEDFAGALRTVDRHFAPALAHPGRLDSFKTLQATKLLTTRLLKAARHRVTLRVGDGVVPGFGPRVPVAALDEWLSMELPAVAKLGDDRNGNDSYARRIQELDDLNDLADRLQRTTVGTR